MQFDPAALIVLNAILACMMFGVALSLKVDDFARIARDPRAPLVGLLAQFLLLPAATCLMTWAFDVDPELALGMILVAACPGGTFSNIMTWIGRANVAASVSMTAVSSLAATVLTPFNFAFYGWLNPHTRALVTEIALDPVNILMLVAAVLALPLLLGMLTARHAPGFAARAQKPLRLASLFVLLGFVAIAFARNIDVFLANAERIVALVVGQNALALALGGRYRLRRASVARRPACGDHGSRHPELRARAVDPVHLLPAGSRHDPDRRLLGHMASDFGAHAGPTVVAQRRACP